MNTLKQMFTVSLTALQISEIKLDFSLF